jgi:hypothetical protein
MPSPPETRILVVRDTATGQVAAMLSDLSTKPAVSPSVAIGIFWGKLVSVDAMRFSTISGEHTIAATEVFLLGHWLKVCGIYARPIATQMVQLKPIGNRTDEHLI